MIKGALLIKVALFTSRGIYNFVVEGKGKMLSVISGRGCRLTAPEASLDLHCPDEVAKVRCDLDGLLADARGSYSVSKESGEVGARLY
mmetsp:Transcript_4019/g.6263  ORF Transcript_4019/g.6263 Transcript_4019/m.6263 type:complete len:88 (-) Transcript_4019:1993-2256(-)